MLFNPCTDWAVSAGGDKQGHTHSMSVCTCTVGKLVKNQKTGEIEELPFFFPQAFGKTSSPCLSPNRSCVQGFSKENHCSSPPVLTFTGESPGDMRKVTGSALLSFFHPTFAGRFGSQLFHTCKPIFNPFLKASDRRTNSYYCS